MFIASRSPSARCIAAITVSLVLAFGLGCSADAKGPRGGAAGQAGSFDNPTPAGASGMSGNIDNPNGTAGSIDLPPPAGAGDGDACGGESFVAEGKSLEIFVLFDNSGSMAIPFAGGGGNWGMWGGTGAGGFGPSTPWDAAVAEMKAFVMNTEASGISLALKYFGEACEPSAYSTPDVPMATLPQNASLIASSLDATMPNSSTATRPALEGAMAFVRQRLATPGYNSRIIVLLVTDGEPDQEDCDGNTLEGTAAVAAAALAEPGAVKTYVLSTAGDIVLDDIASAGGTSTAIPADVSSPGLLADKLIEIGKQELAELPCEYGMPAGYEAIGDPELVNLRHNGVPVGRVDGAAACDPTRGGWFYDDPAAPTQILTCSPTCAVLKQGGMIDVALGCPVVPLPPVQ